MFNRTHVFQKCFLVLGVALALHYFPVAFAQDFNSGSDGSDGPLNLTDPGTIVFNPQDLGLDPDGDRIFHFTTINVASGVTVRMRADVMGSKPVVWLATGDVTIDGTLDLSGEDGHDNEEAHIPSVPGPGGYSGGIGHALNIYKATPGEGPGGGQVGSYGGGGAGHSLAGCDYINIYHKDQNSKGGTAYGNRHLIPLIGGSGGGGGRWRGGGGGAGGGAILIASPSSIIVNGSIITLGGEGGSNGDEDGGQGSDGAIRLVAKTIDGSGTLDVSRHGYNYSPNPTSCHSGKGSPGRIRLEAFTNSFSGILNPMPTAATPGILFPPPEITPQLKVVSVNGVPVPDDPKATFTPPDLEINEKDEVTFNIEAKNIPLDTVIKLTMFSETQGAKTFESTPLAGTLANSTATASTAIPPGFARFTIQANW